VKHPPQEPDVLPGRAITGVGLGVVLATALGVVSVVAIGRCRSRELGELGEHWVPMVRPQITGADINAIETAPFSVEAQGLDEHRREDARLRAYGWIDRAHHIVHVPIDVAIELYVQQHGGGR
jgi:hypothetical protein